MTDTNELRKLLDERDAKWNATDTYRLLVTSWKDASGHDWAFMEHRDGNFSKLTAYHLTPAQAIAATLGAGTCHNVVLAEMEEKASKKYSMAMSALRFGGFMPEDEPAEFECSACGETAKVDWETLYRMSYCPVCGAKVVGE